MPNFTIQNQPTNLKMSDFYALSSVYRGLGKSARFAVRIVPSRPTSLLNRLGYGPFMRQLTYLCETAELPGRGFMNADLRYYGPNFKVPYQTEYQETAMTFLCRTDSFERQFFDDWMEVINPTNTFDFSYKDDYVCQIEMYQFGENSETGTEPVATYAWTLTDAFPILVNPQPVTWADDNFQRLAISFSFTKWMRKGRDPEQKSFSLVNSASVVANPTTR
jgi:hypothetical protein